MTAEVAWIVVVFSYVRDEEENPLRVKADVVPYVYGSGKRQDVGMQGQLSMPTNLFPNNQDITLPVHGALIRFLDPRLATRG